MNLYRILIVLNQPQSQIGLVFQGADSANEAHRSLIGMGTGIARISDNYGNEVHVNRADIAAVIKTDVTKDLEGQAALALAQARANVDAQKQAQKEGLMPRMPQAGLVVPPGRAQ